MTQAEHAIQKARVLASEGRSPDKTEAHNCYPRRKAKP